jgi:2-keto-4-pentenoate hydratase/2-oxohepta-3-ene-1,7-dioic acid hydratase in catechol pathway
MINGEPILFSKLNREGNIRFPRNLIATIESQDIQEALRTAYRSEITRKDSAENSEEANFAAPYYEPPKIWGIGLNYKEHAADLRENTPDEPASFMKPRTTIIGHGDAIRLPQQSKRVTAEAELGVIIGKRCKNISESEAESVIFGYVPVLDMTAEDILQRNPRFLTRAKSFDTFFSFGPIIMTSEEIPDPQELSIDTVLNGQVAKSNKVRNMIFTLNRLISFHSQVMTLEPGDIFSTGTPGAAVIHEGDVAECRIDGFHVLRNSVTSDAEWSS